MSVTDSNPVETEQSNARNRGVLHAHEAGSAVEAPAFPVHKRTKHGWRRCCSIAMPGNYRGGLGFSFGFPKLQKGEIVSLRFGHSSAECCLTPDPGGP
jgi:hypothetical protein